MLEQYSYFEHKKLGIGMDRPAGALKVSVPQKNGTVANKHL